MPRTRDVTLLLMKWSNGDQDALKALMDVVYDELCRIADNYVNQEQPDQALQPAELVNEVYLRLIDYKQVQWQSRAHFFGATSQIMRRILVAYARRRKAVKRGGSDFIISIETEKNFFKARDLDLIALDDALIDLAVIDRQQSRIVELRFITGLSIEETAEALGISSTTVKREWRLAKAWLFLQISKREE